MVHTRRSAEVVGATNVDRRLVGEEGGANGGDDAVGNIVGAAGVGLAGVEGGGLALSDGDTGLVGDVSAARVASGVSLQVRVVTMKPTETRESPYLHRASRMCLIGTRRMALKPLTRPISFWMACFQPKEKHSRSGRGLRGCWQGE